MHVSVHKWVRVIVCIIIIITKGDAINSAVVMDLTTVRRFADYGNNRVLIERCIELAP